MVDISETSVDVLGALFLLDALTEGAGALLDVGELVLILEEKLAAAFAKCDGDVGDHVFVVAAGPLRAELRVVHNEDLLEAHALEDSLIHLDWLVLLWSDLRL